MNNRDVSSEYCQRQKDLLVERLDKFDPKEDAWREAELVTRLMVRLIMPSCCTGDQNIHM